MKFIKRLFSGILIAVIIITAVVVAGGWGKYKQATSRLSIEDAARNIKSEKSFSSIDDISLTFVNAMIAVEDRRFYKHKGIDIIGLGRAIKKNIKEKENEMK